MPGASAAPGPACDITLVPPDSIQAAVDGVGEGGVVCLGDGTYFLGSTSINLDSTHTGLTLRAAEGAYPIIEAVEEAIRLTEAHETTISGLTLVGGVGSGFNGVAIRIFQSDNVTVTHNEIREFVGGVTAAGNPFSGGTYTGSSGFVLSDNEISGGSDGVVLVNCTGCSVIRNQIDTTRRAILVFASNAVGVLAEEGIARGTKIIENQISGRQGIVVSASASADLSNNLDRLVSIDVVSIQQNQITAQRPLLAIASTRSFPGDSPAATAKIKNLGLIRNEIVCDPLAVPDNGVELLASPDHLQDVTIIENTKIIRNTFSGCVTNVFERGNVERTALSPDLRELLDFVDAAATAGAF